MTELNVSDKIIGKLQNHSFMAKKYSPKHKIKHSGHQKHFSANSNCLILDEFCDITLFFSTQIYMGRMNKSFIRAIDVYAVHIHGR